MSEIKSTLELAMERTKKMAISEKEREEIKRKEIERKVNTLSIRYIEGYLPLNEILKELERMDEKTQAKVREIFLSQWIEVLSLSDKEERLFKGIEALKRRSADELKQRHQQLACQYGTEKEQVRENVKTQLIERLRKDGIDGNALEANIEGSSLWREASEALDRLYGARLEEIKKQWKTL